MENKIIEFLEEIESLKKGEFNIIEFDNEVQELYARTVERTNSWDFFTSGDTEEYIRACNYTYCGLGEDYDIDVNIEFEVVEKNEEDVCSSIIKIINIEKL
ncbi:TPA: hypothetical protein KRE09_002323 [Clostridioides difficile]|uniref:hypothetical protein n=1 Tax=Clostridioides difficile TaxID=1496 RepID=UPI0005B4B1F8|nr:hypothetical protein [Clostridioides difficile]AUO78363.1 hypothetical protein LIBA6276_00145 [Clostridioides phage LIBA6276]EJX3365461.1 hypothetical protein [Clostridioides difficile]EJX3377984.1 hypothetical protein [Clostridioides difficile]MCJ0133293.1 hypothetical protein [Clostridioides difficile]MCJ0174318.1 hypothetical protein [Clostridioides difficile]